VHNDAPTYDEVEVIILKWERCEIGFPKSDLALKFSSVDGLARDRKRSFRKVNGSDGAAAARKTHRMIAIATPGIEQFIFGSGLQTVQDLSKCQIIKPVHVGI
jgi:hypothetical protein